MSVVQLDRFFTPADIAAMVVEIADVEGRSVLEPSAGRGALVEACQDVGCVYVDCVEIDAEDADHLRGLDVRVEVGDFLEVVPHPVYDRVVMNPPFTKNQDVRHVEHAIKFVRPGGVLVSIMAGNTERSTFKKLVESLDHEVIPLPEGSFKSSGTGVSTIVLKVRV